MKIDSVIFDMDGVLIDVSRSYRVAIEKTTNYFMKRIGLPVKVTQEDIAQIKNLSGFNNDWDATYMLIELLSKGIRKEKFSNAIKTFPAINKKTKEYNKIREVFQTFYQKLIYAEKCLISNRLLETLISLKLKLGIATGRPRKEALFALKNFDLQKFFPENFVIALEDVRKEKPHPEALLKIKKEWK